MLLVTVVGDIIIGFAMLAVLLSRWMPCGTNDLILFLKLFVFVIVTTVFGLQGANLSGVVY